MTARLRTVRRRLAAAGRLRGRLPLVLLAAACTVAVTAAVSDAGATPPGIRFAQIGHWIASPSQDTVFHVDGAAGAVDARAGVPGIEPGSQVIQGDTSGFVVGTSTITEFDKSTLQVERTMTPPTGERPVGVEAGGGLYLVFREAGTVVRLSGGEPRTIRAGESLGDPVSTPDGTLWLQRRSGNVICRLEPDADQVSCAGAAPAGHTGALTVVGRRAVFVDTQADTLIPVRPNGELERPAPAGVDLPADAKIAGVDVSGRIAVLDPSARRLHLLDASALRGGRPVPAPVAVALPDGDFAAPAAGRDSVVLLDLRGHKVLTYDRTGRPQRVSDVPREAGEPRLTSGGDRRVYVDGGEGKHVLVVGDGGRAEAVPLVGGGPPDASRPPVAPPSETPPTTPVARNPVPDPPRPQSEPKQPPRRPARTPEPPRRPRTEPPRTPAPPRTTPPRTSPAKPVVRPTATKTEAPASPPGTPPGLKASASGTSITVTWRAAAANGAAVTGYRVTWARTSGGGGGSSTRSGGSRSMTITGLTRGTAYTVTVAAQNSAGRGTAATARATVPAPARTVTVSRGPDTTHDDDCGPPECAWVHVEMRGFKPNTSYKIDVFSSEWGKFNPGARLSTNGSGTLVTDRFAFGGAGQRVWVKVDGLESNHYLWPSR